MTNSSKADRGALADSATPKAVQQQADNHSVKKHVWGCDVCASDGFPNQIGHSTMSCIADRILNPEIYSEQL
jgi:hypothetical protein